VMDSADLVLVGFGDERRRRRGGAAGDRRPHPEGAWSRSWAACRWSYWKAMAGRLGPGALDRGWARPGGGLGALAMAATAAIGCFLH
jgi:hypothetical protein